MESCYIPKTFAQALACGDMLYWIDAMAAEIRSLEEFDSNSPSGKAECTSTSV